ncbi:MAG: Co2+/Mg2+ efflux protein ApaG [Pseudomonas sp.]
MVDALAKAIHIEVVTRYLSEQSDPPAGRFAFAYTVTIRNAGTQAAQLLDRHWLITDGNGKVQEVRGSGVIGEQPIIQPGTSHTYTSGCLLETPVGSMRGSYGMSTSEGALFRAPIQVFRLFKPNALN